MMVSDGTDMAVLARLFSGLANATRLTTLLGIQEERPLQEIADEAGVTRNAVQLQAGELEERNLVYRDEEHEYPFRLTPLGQFLTQFVQQNREVLVEAVAHIEEAEQTAHEELEPLLAGETLDNAVEQRKWRLVSEHLSELLQEEG